jgi:hypothetical protein
MRRLLSVRRAATASGVALILALPLVAMQFDGSGVDWTIGDFALAGALLTVVGIALELAVRKAGSFTIAVGIAALGVAAAAFGKADDAPGLVLLGLVLVASACTVGARRAHRSS